MDTVVEVIKVTAFTLLLLSAGCGRLLVLQPQHPAETAAYKHCIEECHTDMECESCDGL